jgi:DNA-binding NarL/FixJ family response regulator
MESPALNLRVIIADDVRADRVLIAEMLTSLGHEVVCQAKNGRELIDACLEHSPELVITDNVMPGVRGLDAASQICARRAIPVIVLSAHTDPEAVLYAEQNCVLVYLVKPLDKANLEAAIALALRRFTESQFGDDSLSPGPRGSKVDEAVGAFGASGRPEVQYAPIR